MLNNKTINEIKYSKERKRYNKKNLMISCIKNNDIENLKTLIKEDGVDIEVDRLNWTYLHYAAFHNNVAAAKEFLKAGLKIDELDNHKETPLYIAVSNESIDMINFLTKHNANILNKDIFGYTALDIAKIRDLYTKHKYEKQIASEILNILETKLLEQQKNKKIIQNIEKSR